MEHFDKFLFVYEKSSLRLTRQVASFLRGKGGRILAQAVTGWYKSFNQEKTPSWHHWDRWCVKEETLVSE